MGVHGEGVHAANIGVRYVAYFQAIFPMSFRWTHLKVKPPVCQLSVHDDGRRGRGRAAGAGPRAEQDSGTSDYLRPG